MSTATDYAFNPRLYAYECRRPEKRFGWRFGWQLWLLAPAVPASRCPSITDLDQERNPPSIGVIGSDCGGGRIFVFFGWRWHSRSRNVWLLDECQEAWALGIARASQLRLGS